MRAAAVAAAAAAGGGVRGGGGGAGGVVRCTRQAPYACASGGTTDEGSLFAAVAETVSSPSSCRREADAYAQCATARLPDLPEQDECKLEVCL